MFPELIYDMAQMTECVASSISRWHGCKAEYYLLSCSTHSDVRWRDDRRRGPGVYFFRRQPLTSCCRRLQIESERLSYRRHSVLPPHKSRSYLGELLAHELRTQARTRCESISVPQDNPLDTRPQIGTANHTTDMNK